MRQAELKKYYIKMVHTLKREFFPDEECRLLYMQSKFGKSSTKEMSIDELREMLLEMGYKPKNSQKVAKTTKPKSAGAEKATQAQIDTITDIWNTIARVKTPWALRKFIERITGEMALHLWYLNKKEASKVIVALTKMQKEHFEGSQIHISRQEDSPRD